MIEKLLDFLERFWESIVPWVIVPQYEEGVILRLGKFNRIISKGFNPKWPMIESFDNVSIVMQTIELPTQTLGDRIIAFIIRYQINDVKTYLLDVHDASDVIRDISLGAVRRATQDYNEPDDIEKSAKRRLKRSLKKYGVLVHEATITDYGKIKSLRIIMDEAE